MDKSKSKIQDNDPSLIPAWDIIRKWKKEILVFVIAAVSIAAIATVFMPKKYYSSVTIIPTNSELLDKARFTNKNIEQLYSIYGTGDDLDRLYALTNTRSMYKFIADSFMLAGAKADESTKAKTIAKLRKQVDIEKTPNGELVIGVWTKDRQFSANIANAIVERLRQVNKEYLAEFNKPALEHLRKNLAFAGRDSVPQSLQDSGNYRQAIAEIINSIETAPAPFVITDKAMPAYKAGKPRVWLILISTLLASLLFSMLLAMLLERRKSNRNGSQQLLT